VTRYSCATKVMPTTARRCIKRVGSIGLELTESKHAGTKTAFIAEPYSKAMSGRNDP
jgi:hypothetical protein